ncbi:unnamed protein product, partial [Amoebophrya sp. A25]|eukprot:GSA25T00013507001.1
MEDYLDGRVEEVRQKLVANLDFLATAKKPARDGKNRSKSVIPGRSQKSLADEDGADEKRGESKEGGGDYTLAAPSLSPDRENDMAVHNATRRIERMNAASKMLEELEMLLGPSELPVASSLANSDDLMLNSSVQGKKRSGVSKSPTTKRNQKKNGGDVRGQNQAMNVGARKGSPGTMPAAASALSRRDHDQPSSNQHNGVITSGSSVSRLPAYEMAGVDQVTSVGIVKTTSADQQKAMGIADLPELSYRHRRVKELSAGGIAFPDLSRIQLSVDGGDSVDDLIRAFDLKGDNDPVTRFLAESGAYARIATENAIPFKDVDKAPSVRARRKAAEECRARVAAISPERAERDFHECGVASCARISAGCFDGVAQMEMRKKSNSPSPSRNVVAEVNDKNGVTSSGSCASASSLFSRAQAMFLLRQPHKDEYFNSSQDSNFRPTGAIAPLLILPGGKKDFANSNEMSPTSPTTREGSRIATSYSPERERYLKMRHRLATGQPAASLPSSHSQANRAFSSSPSHVHRLRLRQAHKWNPMSALNTSLSPCSAHRRDSSFDVHSANINELVGLVSPSWTNN